MPNATTSRNGVFISYARTDGEKFADLLRRRLQTENIRLWQDRVGMEGGRNWWLQITEALDQVEFMALVMTPNALKSETVRKEWRYARQQGVCVYPIQGTKSLDLKSLPRWMEDAHFYDLGTVQGRLNGREWESFVNALKTRCKIQCVPFMVEDLPEGFVPRPGEFDQLLNQLIGEEREESVAITAALRGAGGYGKTTLAQALCHDERIQDAFDDGILWVTLGEKPGNLTGRVEDLIVTLGDERPGFTTIDGAINRLKELLADRHILIVVDDVWNRADLNPFIQGGPHCVRLITTRNFDTLPPSAVKVQVDAMQQDQATALLSNGLDPAALKDRTLRRELKELAARLGEWPLLLRLVNSALLSRIENDNQSAQDAVGWVNQALTKRGLTYFDADNSESRHQAVAKTLGVSLGLINVRDRERYGELAIFPEDVEIPLTTIEKLWRSSGGLDEFDTDDLCRRLNSYSLLSNYDFGRRRIRLHDVTRKFLVEQQAQKLGSINSQLLDVHRPLHSSTSAPAWSEMPADEPYLWDHLAHHLVNAGRGDELLATIKDWRYLVTKALIRKSLAVEADLVIAEKIAGHDDALRLLRRNFVNSGHLLSKCENQDDIKATLFSRLRHLAPLSAFTDVLVKNLKRPYLTPTYELPDLPHPALIRTLSAHSGSVIGCAISADAETIVSASEDQTLKIWDRRTGAERLTLSGHEGRVFNCAISADGSTIISASEDETLKVWNGQNGIEQFTLRGHTGAVLGCAVSADGSVIVSSSEDFTLKVWDGRTGAEQFTLIGHNGAVSSCAISADGLIIVSASEDCTLKLWEAQSGTEVLTLQGHTGWVRVCAISADGRTVVSASEDQTLKVWSTSDGTQRHTLQGHLDWVRGCAISADGTIIVSASDDHTVKVWDGKRGAEILTLTGHAGLVFGCAISPDGATIVSVSEDQMLKVWDEYGGVEDTTLHTTMGEVLGCAVAADGMMVVSTLEDGSVRVWEKDDEKERYALRGHGNDVNGCAVSADGSVIVSVSDDQTVKVWDAKTGTHRFTLLGHQDQVNGCAASADGAIIVSAATDRTLKVWDGATGTERFTLTGHADAVRSCAISWDGTTIVSACNDHTLKLWSGRDGSERFTFTGHSDWVNDCAMSADGTRIISASEDHTLKVWDGRAGAEFLTLKGHSDGVRGCAVSADGTTVFSASEDQTLKVWNGSTGECLSTLRVDGGLYDCACSADGEIVVAAGARGVYFLRLVR